MGVAFRIGETVVEGTYRVGHRLGTASALGGEWNLDEELWCEMNDNSHDGVHSGWVMLALFRPFPPPFVVSSANVRISKI